jgi:uncharacterized protein YcaQ
LTPLSTSPTIRRRFILGRQGLWPGRRWAGKDGTAAALRHAEAVQIDPVAVIAPSSDIVLWGRVLDYQPADLHALAYEERRFFDYGTALFFYPMTELPYWRVLMERYRGHGRWSDFMAAHPALLDEVRAELRDRGPLRGREFDGKKVQAYRSSKDTGLALYALWLTGELMTHGRHGRERIYGFTEDIAPAALQRTAAAAEAEAYFLRKGLAEQGLSSARAVRAILRDARGTAVNLDEARALLARMVAAGEIEATQIAGQKEPHYYLAGDRPLLEALLHDQTPTAWQPLGPSTAEEITFLSPLERVSARGRARELFDFDYIWEIYKPEAQRVYGPYTLPILYGDRLVGRVDGRLDRPRRTLVLNGLWLEEWFAPDEAFADALRCGLARLGEMLGAEEIDRSGVGAWWIG